MFGGDNSAIKGLIGSAERSLAARDFERAVRSAGDAISRYLSAVAKPGSGVDRALVAQAQFVRGRAQIGLNRIADAVETLVCACPTLASEDDAVVQFLLREAPGQTGFALEIRHFALLVARRLARGPQSGSTLAALARLFQPRLGDLINRDDLEAANGEVSRLFPSLGWPRFHLGVLRAERGDLGAALTHFEAARRASPNAAAEHMYAWTLAAMGKPVDVSQVAAGTGDAAMRVRCFLEAEWRRAQLDFAGAAAAMERAAALTRLNDGELLALTEAHVNAGHCDRAALALSQLSEGATESPVARLLVGAVAAGEGKLEEALSNLVALVADTGVGGEAARICIEIVDAHPALSGAMAAMECVPTVRRISPYLQARAAALSAQGRCAEALAVWGQCERLRPLDQERRDLTRLMLARERLSEGRAADALQLALDAAETGHLKHAACATAMRALAAVLVDVREVALPRLAALLKAAINTWPALLSTPASSELIGVLASYCDATEGERAVEGMSREALLAMAQAQLALGRGDRARSLLSSAGSDPDQAALALAADVWEGRVTPDDARLSAPGFEDLCAAAAYRVGSVVSNATPVGRFFQAQGAIDRGEHSSDLADLFKAVQDSPTVGVAAKRALAWLKLKAIGGEARSDGQALLENVFAADALWPGVDGALRDVRRQDAPIAILVGAGARAGALSGIEREAKGGELCDPAFAHALGVVSVSLAIEHAAAGADDAAAGHLSRAAGELGVTLAADSYLDAWRAQRLRRYGDLPDAGDIPLWRGLADAVIHAVESASAHLAALGHDGFARQAEVFSEALECEIAAARALASAGGLRDGHGAGPLYVARAGLHRDLSRAISGAGAQAPGLERQFSALRRASALRASGDAESALEALQRRPQPCPTTRSACPSGPLAGCEGCGHEVFVLCNPCFADESGAANLRHEARSFQLELLLETSRRRVALDAVRGEDLEGLWREAHAIGGELGRGPATSDAIADIALGRCQSLMQQERWRDAGLVLNAASAVVADPYLIARHAEVLAIQGIDAANAQADFGQAVAKLRAAYVLNPVSIHVKRNFLRAIRAFSADAFRSDIQRAIRILEDGAQVSRMWLWDDPLNEEAKEHEEALYSQLSIVSRVRSATKAASATPKSPAAPPSRDTSVGDSVPAGNLDSLLSSLKARRHKDPDSKS